MAFGPPTVLASCNPGRSPHDTVARYAAAVPDTVTNLTGVSALIDEYNPYYSGFSHTGTNATVLLANGDITRWAQLGWFKSKIKNNVTVYREAGLQFNTPQTGAPFEWFGSEPVNGSTWYQIQKRPNQQVYDFFVGGDYVATYSGSVNPANYQLFGETHDRWDQMPGGGLDPVRFRNVTYFVGHAGETHLADTDPDPHFLFGMSHPEPGKYLIYDKNCTL